MFEVGREAKYRRCVGSSQDFGFLRKYEKDCVERIMKEHEAKVVNSESDGYIVRDTKRPKC